MLFYWKHTYSTKWLQHTNWTSIDLQVENSLIVGSLLVKLLNLKLKFSKTRFHWFYLSKIRSSQVIEFFFFSTCFQLFYLFYWVLVISIMNIYIEYLIEYLNEYFRYINTTIYYFRYINNEYLNWISKWILNITQQMKTSRLGILQQ